MHASEARIAPKPAPATVLPEREAKEADRLTAAFRVELRPTGEVGLALVRIAAMMSVRVERCAMHEAAMSTDRVRRAIAEFVPPEGCTEAEAAKLRDEASHRALFDPAPEMAQSRRYEAAAGRTFFRALKELRLHEGAVKAARAEAEETAADRLLASFSPGAMTDAEFDSLSPEEGPSAPRPGVARPAPMPPMGPGGRFEVPIEVRRRR